jgi:hypothetical protein
MTRLTQAIAAVCAALVLASCGGDDGEPIPERRAATLERLLQQVQRQSDAGSCTTLIDATIPRLENEAERLPESVGSDTQETISDGIAHLRDLAETDCAEKEQEELPDTTESTTTSEPTTTQTTETQTEETTTETTPPDEPTTETTPPDNPETTPPDEPDPGNGGTPPGQGGTPPGQNKNGNGRGNGNGNGKP